jgi:Ca2+-binding RTX toxin-like protein
MHDELFRFYSGQKLIVGITDYNNVPDYNGTDISLFAGYLELDNPDIINDRENRSLIGSDTADYIHGLDGNDRIDGRAGVDLLSGGNGNDIILGGSGGDILAGGLGQDSLTGGYGRDRFTFTDIAHSVVGRADIVRDFNVADDKIAVDIIDAQAHVAGNQSFEFIHSANFTAEGQIRAVQLSDSSTALRFNISGSGGAEMEIILKNVDASTLTDLNFIR